jgi:hypothetical protein
VQGRSDDQRELLDAESLAGHLLKAGSFFGFLAGHRQELFPDEMFADVFPTSRGRPSVPADVMACVITLQALRGLSDAETVDAVTFDLRWKAACGLPVTVGAFHPTTLTYWRRRLADSQRPNRIFEAVKAVVAQSGALTGKTRRALDSTVLDDAVATQDTVTQLIGAIRRVRREVPGAAEVIAATAARTTMTTRASPRSPGTTPMPGSSWSIPWSATPTACWGTCRAGSGAPRGRGGGAAGPDRRSRRGTGRGLRWHRRTLAHCPTGGH